jgi:hypothetical protein
MTAQIEVTIANGASQSSEVDLRNLLLCGIVMPADWTAANLTFLGAAGAQDGVNDIGLYQDVYDADGTELNVTAASDRHIVVSPSAFAGIQYLKVRSGTTGTPVNQGAARTLYLVCRSE